MVAESNPARENPRVLGTPAGRQPWVRSKTVSSPVGAAQLDCLPDKTLCVAPPALVIIINLSQRLHGGLPLMPRLPALVRGGSLHPDRLKCLVHVTTPQRRGGEGADRCDPQDTPTLVPIYRLHRRR